MYKIVRDTAATVTVHTLAVYMSATPTVTIANAGKSNDTYRHSSKGN
jgi:hypothetical protein